MTEKRKPTYEQALALDRGRATRRANLRRDRAATTTEPLPPHEHKFGDWTCRYVGSGYEKRYCKCGCFEVRPVRL